MKEMENRRFTEPGDTLWIGSGCFACPELYECIHEKKQQSSDSKIIRNSIKAIADIVKDVI